MRDAFGEIDPDEIEIIDFIESDPSAFSAPEQSGGEAEPSGHRGSRRGWLIATGIASVVAIATVAVLVWSPWSDDNKASFPDGATPELTLAEELVFDNPPAELSAASLGLATDDDFGFGSFENGEGYFFGEPGATWVLNGQPSGTWAVFLALPEGDENAPDTTADDGETTGTVQGAPAVFSSMIGGAREIGFGPVDGWMFSVVSSGMSLADSLAFAEAVGVDDGLPTVNSAVIGSMLPIGDIADYSVVQSTVFAATSPFGELPGTVSVHYGDFLETGASYSITTRPVASDATLTMLQFVLGADDRHLVRGHPAIATDTALNLFGDALGQTGSLVAWVEGGRLIVVAGPDDVAEVLALAETVRPATEDEWAQVVAAAQNHLDPSIPLFPVADPVTLYQDVDPATGDTFSLTVELADGSVTMCVEEQSNEGSRAQCDQLRVEPPFLTKTDDTSGRQFVVAMIDRGVGDDAELRITLADGTIETFPLVDAGDDLPGRAVATLLPEGHGAVELWIGAKVVATL